MMVYISKCGDAYMVYACTHDLLLSTDILLSLFEVPGFIKKYYYILIAILVISYDVDVCDIGVRR